MPPQDANPTPSFGGFGLSNEFGTSVSISGETLAVGAPRDDHNVTTTGSAYVYVRSGTTWSQQQKITAADGSQDDNFGASVSLSGDTVAVGANRDADNGSGSGSGSAYVYTRTGTTWTQQQKLTAGDGATGYIFGTSVALDVSTLLVGSPGNLTSTGAAYVYTRSGTTWTQQQKLTAVDGAISDSFGGSVSLSGETAVVGTPLSDALATDSGAAYAFLRTGTTWGLEQKVVAQDAAADDNNGYSVAVSGNTLAVGAPGTNPKGNDSGSVDILERTGPEEVEHRQKLTAGDGAPGDRFGASVDVDLPNLLVGAPGTSTNASTGSAYVFTRGTTTTTDLIVDIDAVTNLADNKISVNLPAGTYTLAVVGPDKGGAYTAWNAWGFVSGCPGLPDGSGCGTGWLTYHTFSSSLGEQVLESNGRFETPEQALAAVTDGTVVTLPTAETVQFWIPDFFPAPENLAGVSVRILATTAWREQQKLIASDGQTGDDFGSSVGLSGSYAVVGAPDNGTSTGAAYVFYRTGTSTWSQLQKLTATDGEEGDSFGTSVAVSGDTAVVGAPDNASSTGAAYVLKRNGTSTWSQLQKLTGSDGQVGDKFGSSIAISGDRLVVGAPDHMTSTGAAYVFRTGSPWAQEAKLTDSAGVTGDSFGSSVAVRDGQIVIGSPGTDGSGADSGSAHLFWYDGSTWVNVFELTATDGAAGDSSGSSVAIDGGTSVVGAPHVNVDGLSNVGRVQLHLAPFSDLSVVKSPSPGFVLIGDTLTYTITVTNNGPETSTEVVIQDALPANLSYVSSTASLGTCSESGGTVTCDIGDLGVGVSAQVTIHTTVIAEGPVNNTAQAYGSVFDPSLTNNTSTSFTTAFLLTPVPSLSWLGLVALAAALGGASYLGMRRRRPSTA